MRRFMLFFCAFALGLTGAADASAKPTRGDRCEAFLLKATGKSVHCRIREERHELLRNVTPDFDVCDAALDRAIRRADRRFGSDCPSIEEAEILAGLHAEATETLVGAVTAPPWSPTNHTYVAITFDDGLGDEALDSLATLMSLKNPPNQGETEGSTIRLTYFTTTIGSQYASVDYWHKKGHEVANHTVTHPLSSVAKYKLGEEWDNDGGASWLQELTEQDQIMELWGDVPPGDVTGLRCPNLACNSALFSAAIPQWSKSKLANGAKFTYDSSLTIIPGPPDPPRQPGGFAPPFLVSKGSNNCETAVKSYARVNLYGTLKYCDSPPQGCGKYDCPAYWSLDSVDLENFWEVPMPPLMIPTEKPWGPPWPASAGAWGNQEPNTNCPAEMPNCLTPAAVKETFDYNYAVAKATQTPMMIALHTGWLKKGETSTSNSKALTDWVSSTITADPTVRFVTVSALVTMYAAQNEEAIVPASVLEPTCHYKTGGAPGSLPDPTHCGPPIGLAIPSPDQATADARCNSQCVAGGSPNYGLPPDTYSACLSPATSYNTTTCKHTCGGPISGPVISQLQPRRRTLGWKSGRELQDRNRMWLLSGDSSQRRRK